MAAHPTPLLPRRWRRVIGVERLILAAVCAVSLVFRFRWGLGSITFEPANFIGYLTIQSNIAFTLVSIATAVAVLRGVFVGARLDALRAAALTCTVSSGIGYAVILQQSAARGIRVDVPWSDVVLHFILPVLAIADWMLILRHRTRMIVVVMVLTYVRV